MDLKKIIRNLVTGNYLPDFDYLGHEFALNTVFYISYPFYYCCSCSFEHEYLDYLSRDENEKMYENVVYNMENGQCPHVINAPEEYVLETSLYGMHVAAVLGTVSTKTYDKRDDFDIVNFPFLDRDVRRRTSYGVYISQLIRFAHLLT